MTGLDNLAFVVQYVYSKGSFRAGVNLNDSSRLGDSSFVPGQRAAGPYTLIQLQHAVFLLRFNLQCAFQDTCHSPVLNITAGSGVVKRDLCCVWLTEKSERCAVGFSDGLAISEHPEALLGSPGSLQHSLIGDNVEVIVTGEA